MTLTRTRNGRRLLFAVLYLSEGAPIGFIWWAMPTLLRSGDTQITGITGVLALLALPWAFKFLWAPAVDACRSPRWGYRCWIVAAQIVMIATLTPLMVLDAAEHLPIVAALLVGHALAAATQDVAIDAWAIRLTPEAEHGALNASMQTGMLTGRWLFGAGLLMATAWVSRPVAIAALAGVIAIAAVVVLLCEEGVDDPDPPSRNWQQFVDRLRAGLTGPVMWIGVAIALLSGAAYEAVGPLVGPLLIDRGLDEAGVGYVHSANLLAMLTGVWIGGKIGDRIGHRIAMIAFTVALAAIVATLGGLTATPHTPTGHALVIGAIGAMYLGIGMFIAASYALFMDLTDPAMAGTQFSAFMGATNGCEAWAAAVVGVLVTQYGWGVAFVLMAGASMWAIPLLIWLGRVRARVARAERGPHAFPPHAASASKSMSWARSPE